MAKWVSQRNLKARLLTLIAFLPLLGATPVSATTEPFTYTGQMLNPSPSSILAQYPTVVGDFITGSLTLDCGARQNGTFNFSSFTDLNFTTVHNGATILSVDTTNGATDANGFFW
jgi:hypothetical protein